MLYSLLIAAGAIIGMMLLWAVVQLLWRQTFADNIAEEDVLAERRSCGNCGCTKVCDRKAAPGSVHSVRTPA